MAEKIEGVMTRRLIHLLRIAALLLGVKISLLGTASAQTAPPSTPAASRIIEGVEFKPTASLLFLTPEQQRVAYRNVHLLAPSNLIRRGPSASPLPHASLSLADFTYDHRDRARTLDDFVTDMKVAGLLVLKDGRVVLERYAHGHRADSVWTSFSVAKSVVSLLYGVALADGAIKSLDDSVSRYLPALRGSVYDAVTLRHLLQMSSGVAWNEDESDPNSDLAQIGRLGRAGGIEGLLSYMKKLPRKAPAGTAFNYNTGETHIAGAVLRAATGQPLAQYLSTKIWQPAGMEADAHWLLLREGDVEHGGCCISATLRDFGRLGLLASREGVAADGTRVIPKDWIRAATTPASTNPRYGFLWWLPGGGRFAASGIFGQYVYVDLEHHVVIAIQSLWPVAYNQELPAHQRAFVEALAAAVGRRGFGSAAATPTAPARR
jgi:CubicO group peptidase (beta-lactamase class C family)